MKTSHPAAATAAILAMSLAITLPATAVPGTDNGIGNDWSADPLIPVGSVSAYPTIVQAGTHPVLTWGIDYPESVRDIVTISPDGTITPNEDMVLELTVLGASYQTGVDNHGDPIWGMVDAQVRADGATTWTRYFYDTQDKVKPTKVVHTQTVRQARPIHIRGRCHNGSYWLPYRTSGTSSPNVVVLTDGETPPDTVPAFQQGEIESFLQPYIDSSGHIVIGPKDVIFLIELGQTNPNASGFDLQDLVVLATFITEPKSNNGHGNNIDGIDMSNPGKAPFIPMDTDPTFDDEGKGGGAYPSLP